MFQESDKVIYKQILCDDEAKDYNDKFLDHMNQFGFNTTIALSTGHRQYIDINLKISIYANFRYIRRSRSSNIF